MVARFSNEQPTTIDEQLAMKRSWTTILLALGLVGLLVLLGVMQYRWLSQISESDGEKAHKRVQEQADRFAADFNREIQGVYFNLQTDASKWKEKDWSQFNERFDFWRDKAAYPDLVSNVYFFEAKENVPPLQFSRAERTFKPIDITPELSELRSKFTNDRTFRTVYDEQLALVQPIHEMATKLDRIVVRATAETGGLASKPMIERMPDRYGYLVIMLDPAVIKDKLLPDLTAKYFGDEEFRTAVNDKAGQAFFRSINGENSDAQARLQRLPRRRGGR